jgi:hypothetical protein
MGEYERARKDITKPVHFIFIVQLPKIAGGCFTGFQVIDKYLLPNKIDHFCFKLFFWFLT